MYCSQSDLEDRIDPQLLRALTDDDDDGLADTSLVNAAITDADALIDTYLRARYTVPLSPVPDAVLSISASVAIYFLLMRRREIVPAEHQKRYEAAIELLDQLARGEIALGAAQSSTSSHLPQSSRDTDDRTFDDDSLDSF